MKRSERIEVLEQVQSNIERAERMVNIKEEDTYYYRLFGTPKESFAHDKEIRVKALSYWKRRFNRELEKLKY